MAATYYFSLLLRLDASKSGWSGTVVFEIGERRLSDPQHTDYTLNIAGEILS
jgi:hypothetical protein